MENEKARDQEDMVLKASGRTYNHDQSQESMEREILQESSAIGMGIGKTR